MRDADDIIEVLEGTTPCARVRGTDRVRTAEHSDAVLWRNSLMRFLSELDGDLTVEAVRSALEDYQ